MTKKTGSEKWVYVCNSCGSCQSKWVGKCPDCGGWNTLVEEVGTTAPGTGGRGVKGGEGGAVPLGSVSLEEHPRVFCGLAELDRVLGGGLVPGSLVLISGDPGIGKSTLVLQALYGLAHRGWRMVYASGEESGAQIRMRAQRLNTVHDGILVTNSTDLEGIMAQTLQAKAHMLVVDSIQTIHTTTHPASPGSVAQVRECTAALLEFAKSRGITTWIIGHVTKDGAIAGPRLLEHLVDAVLYLEGDHTHGFRILRGVKNRFGSTGEVGVFAMQGRGLVDVANPSAYFLQSHREASEGAAVAISMEGTRPLLVEVQTLVGRTTYATPRRLVTGLDVNRFSILVAVLEKRAGINLSAQDIYANAAGGLKLLEPASDLAVSAALASSAREKPLATRCAFFGEVGLSGEVRATTHALARVQEACKMGFEKVYLPRRSFESEKAPLQQLGGESGVALVPVEHVGQLCRLIAEDMGGGARATRGGGTTAPFTKTPSNPT